MIRSLSPLPANIEIILVDQNTTGEGVRKEELLEMGLNRDQVKIVRRSLGSLSSARNDGFRRCRGTFVGIPDDDNYYDESFRKEIVEMLTSIRSDKECGGAVLNWKAFRGFPTSARKMKNWESLRYGNSGTIIVRRDVVCRELGMSPFPEDMSPGTRYPAGDETYFLANFLKRSKLSMVATPTIYIDHPIFPENDERERVYGYGFGALAYKLLVMGWGPGVFYAVRLMIGPVIRMLSFPIKNEAKSRALLMLNRRWKGAIDYATRRYEDR